jgi:hypothetical protein
MGPTVFIWLRISGRFLWTLYEHPGCRGERNFLIRWGTTSLPRRTLIHTISRNYQLDFKGHCWCSLVTRNFLKASFFPSIHQRIDISLLDPNISKFNLILAFILHCVEHNSPTSKISKIISCLQIFNKKLCAIIMLIMRTICHANLLRLDLLSS